MPGNLEAPRPQSLHLIHSFIPSSDHPSSPWGPRRAQGTWGGRWLLGCQPQTCFSEGVTAGEAPWEAGISPLWESQGLPGGGSLQAAAEAVVGGSSVRLALRRGSLAQPECGVGAGGPLNPAQTWSCTRTCVWRARVEVSQAEARVSGPWRSVAWAWGWGAGSGGSAGGAALAAVSVGWGRTGGLPGGEQRGAADRGHPAQE